MSVDFYLQIKKKYDYIEIYLGEIIKNYDDLIELFNNNNSNNEVDNDIFTSFLDDYSNKKTQVLLMKKQINDQLMLRCKHEIISDTIDLDPEYSVNIKYCVKCECNIE
jgi:hypothetical protein